MKFVLGTAAATMALTTTVFAAGAVTVSGAVKKPGTFTVEKSQTLREAIREMGGFTADADLRAIRVTTEQGETRTVDLTQLGKRHQVNQGDSVFVPAIDRSTHVIVRGGVAREGGYVVKPGMTVGDVLSEAGSMKSGAPEGVRVVRTESDGTVKVLKENLLAMHVRPGDTVVAPYMGYQRNSDRDLLTIALVGFILIVLFD
ncbi:MAG TPA: SLBB domain-containing protein [Fimbriimonadaceae bacterium]|nr:SLBB domain-containing protein [Fimbriimonadaceae bacterium]